MKPETIKHSDNSLFLPVSGYVYDCLKSDSFKQLVHELATDCDLMDSYKYLLMRRDEFDNPSNWDRIVSRALNTRHPDRGITRHLPVVLMMLRDAASECGWMKMESFQKGKETISICVIMETAANRNARLQNAQCTLFSVKNVDARKQSVLLNFTSSAERKQFGKGKHELDAVDLNESTGQVIESKTYSGKAILDDGYRKLAVLKYVHRHNKWNAMPILGNLFGENQLRTFVRRAVWDKGNPLELDLEDFILVSCNLPDRMLKEID